MLNSVSRQWASILIVLLTVSSCILYGCDETENKPTNQAPQAADKNIACPIATEDSLDPAVVVLREALKKETGWVKVHAAEGLLFNGYGDEARKAFLPEAKTAGPTYRIGVWRVLAQATSDNAMEREEYVDKIVQAFLDIDAPDRENAVETLGKLKYSQRSEELLAVARYGQGSFQAYARWVLANSGNLEDEDALTELLSSENERARSESAYGLRYLNSVSPKAVERLQAAFAKEPVDSPIRVYILSALYVHCSPDYRPELKRELLKYILTGNADEKKEAFAAFAYVGEKQDILLLRERLVNETDADVRVFCADALLRIKGRTYKLLQEAK